MIRVIYKRLWKSRMPTRFIGAVLLVMSITTAVIAFFTLKLAMSVHSTIAVVAIVSFGYAAFIVIGFGGASLVVHRWKKYGWNDRREVLSQDAETLVRTRDLALYVAGPADESQQTSWMNAKHEDDEQRARDGCAAAQLVSV
jgi:hypothetical protein